MYCTLTSPFRDTSRSMVTSCDTGVTAADPSVVDNLEFVQRIQDLSLDHDSDPGIERDGYYSGDSPPSSPKVTPSHVLETKSLLNMYTNVESRVVADMEQEDQYLASLAEIKRDIARVERRLAHCRAKETLVLHRIQLIRQALADKRNIQAEINVERIKSYQKRLLIEPRTVGQPEDIFTILSRPSTIAPKPLVA